MLGFPPDVSFLTHGGSSFTQCEPQLIRAKLQRLKEWCVFLSVPAACYMHDAYGNVMYHCQSYVTGTSPTQHRAHSSTDSDFHMFLWDCLGKAVHAACSRLIYDGI
jgi:hypothetical protein